MVSVKIIYLSRILEYNYNWQGYGFMITERISALRKLMAKENLGAYIIPNSDYHCSPYLHPHFKCMEFISGFTGSEGTLVFLHGEAALFTDSRYFIQAEAQLNGSGITLMKVGLPNTPSISEYILERLRNGAAAGAYLKTFNADLARRLKGALSSNNISFTGTKDLVGAIWEDRPALPKNPVEIRTEEYTGASTEAKLNDIRLKMRNLFADAHLLTSLSDIAWLFNIRGDDIPYNPVPLCYAIIERDDATLFIDSGKLGVDAIKYFAKLGVKISSYEAVYRHIADFSGKNVLLDSHYVNAELYALAERHSNVINAPNPTIMFKAVKNRVEIDNFKIAHLHDGVAMAKFLYYLEHNAGGSALTEMVAAKKLLEFRLLQGALSESFASIIAYKEHAAIVHYVATPETDVKINKDGMLLVDSGGQYTFGTTDVTRTIALGPVQSVHKRHFTLVLKGMLRLSALKFPYDCGADKIDCIAREHLWNAGFDYLHGTGHGIGSMLNVHEPPIKVNYRLNDQGPLLPGMVLSNEPGIYIENSHGIRIENQLYVKKADEAGNFNCFGTFTLVPIDTSLILTELLSSEEIAQLNAYHARVYAKISPYLTVSERSFFKEITKAIGKGAKK